MAQPLRVALLVDTSTGWSSQVIQGVGQYVRQHTRWLLFIEPRGALERLRVPRHWQVDGIIARVTDRSLAGDLRRRQVPVVNVSWSRPGRYHFPQVVPDQQAVGRLAALHFLERGFRHFAYCGLPQQPNYFDECEPAFAAELAQHGFTCQSFSPGSTRPAHRAVTVPNLSRWLKSLASPIGVLAWDAERGREVTDAAWACGVRVPEDVAVLCGEDDPLLCEISNPPLSCIDQQPRLVGYEAAALLDRLMAGRRPPKQPMLIAPTRIVIRQSTDTLALEDREVAEAVRYIRQHADQPITVESVLAAVPLSRRALEQRFQRLLGRSPAAEIRRMRIERASELLAMTDWSIPQVAAAAGFAHTEVMNRVFRRELRQTPTAYRRQARRADSKGTSER